MREINYEKFKAGVVAQDYFFDSTIHGIDYYYGIAKQTIESGLRMQMFMKIWKNT